MVFNLWSILLIASASQCIFLIVLFVIKPPANKNALRVLICLLLVILGINVNNLWYAGQLYKSTPYLAGFARGTTLLLGPLFYFYTVSIIRQGFRFKVTHLLHLIPYFMGQLLIDLQASPGSIEDAIEVIEQFTMGELKTSPFSITRFILYGVHLIIYIWLSRHQMLASLEKEEKTYLTSTEIRVSWLNKVNWILILITAAQIGFTIYMISTGYLTIYSNFVMTLLMSVLVYMIAYQVISKSNHLLPSFDTKYEGMKLAESETNILIERLTAIFETEKVYKNPDLKVQDVALKLGVSSHLVSTLINKHLDQSFFELLNKYRIEEFMAIAHLPAYANYSIMGIANDVGYRSKSSFNTAFKKHTGQTPSEFIKKKSLRRFLVRFFKSRTSNHD